MFLLRVVVGVVADFRLQISLSPTAVSLTSGQLPSSEWVSKLAENRFQGGYRALDLRCYCRVQEFPVFQGVDAGNCTTHLAITQKHLKQARSVGDAGAKASSFSSDDGGDGATSLISICGLRMATPSQPTRNQLQGLFQILAATTIFDNCCNSQCFV